MSYNKSNTDATVLDRAFIEQEHNGQQNQTDTTDGQRLDSIIVCQDVGNQIYYVNASQNAKTQPVTM
jgi:hypothetical protein